METLRDAGAAAARAGGGDFESWVRELLGPVTFAPLAVEASTRRFFRVDDGATTRVAMHSPPESENNGQFLALAGIFGGAGIPVPEVLHADAARGFFVVTDMGGRDFAGAYADGDFEAPLAAAIDALVDLQSIASDRIPPYTRERFADEVAIFADWFVARLVGAGVDPVFEEAGGILIDATQSVPRCTVHRDYHCRNLLWHRGALGIVDFQDALAGPATYDIASLLRDCYHEFDEADVARWRDRYLERSGLLDRPGVDGGRAGFERAFDLTAIQRQLKAIGIFVRLHYRLGRSSHLGDVLPVLRRVIRLCGAYAELGGLADWLAGLEAPAAAALGRLARP